MHKTAGLMVIFLFLIGTIQANAALPDTVLRVGATETPGITWGVFVQGDYAYIADRVRITVVDKSIPTSPWVRSSLNSGPPVAALGVFVRDTVAYLNPIGLGSSFVTVSVSNPDTLYMLDWITVSPSSGDPTGVVTLDTITYLAIGDDGFMMIDVSSPTSIDTIRSYNTPGLALDLFVKDTLVYIADLESLQIVNVVDPTSPFRVGAVDLPTGCYGIDVVGNIAYVACQSLSGNDGRLHLVDISNPSLPQIIGSVNNINGDPVDVQVQGNFAYVAATDHFFPNVEGGVRVIDISDSLNPILVASYDTPGNPQGIFAASNLIYVADEDSLQILQHITVGIEEEKGISPSIIGLKLLQNEPNPFQRSTSIKYQITNYTYVTLKIYNIRGGLVKYLVNEEKNPGLHSLMWDGRDESGVYVGSGVYYYQLRTGSQAITKKMLIMR